MIMLRNSAHGENYKRLYQELFKIAVRKEKCSGILNKKYLSFFPRRFITCFLFVCFADSGEFERHIKTQREIGFESVKKAY